MNRPLWIKFSGFFRTYCFFLILGSGLISLNAIAFEEYNFKIMNPSNRDQFVIKSIDNFYKAIDFDDVDEIIKSQYKQYLISNTKSKYGNSPLVFAIQSKSRNVIKYISQLTDFNVNNENNSGENALMMAAFIGDLSTVEYLIDKRNARINKDGWTPLHYAAINGDLEIVNYLLKHGAEVDCPSPNETTPLMLAARYGHIRVVKLLLDKGADLSAINQQDLTPIDFAKMYNQREIAEGLESRWKKLYKVDYEPIVDKLPDSQ